MTRQRSPEEREDPNATKTPKQGDQMPTMPRPTDPGQPPPPPPPARDPAGPHPTTREAHTPPGGRPTTRPGILFLDQAAWLLFQQWSQHLQSPFPKAKTHSCTQSSCSIFHGRCSIAAIAVI
ncbi:hypothetical protein EMCRGX_G011487 [Ephydatia muelleri]